MSCPYDIIRSLSLIFLLSISVAFKLIAEEKGHTIRFEEKGQLLTLNKNIYLYEDSTRSESFEEVKTKQFERYDEDGIINLGLTQSNIWLKATIHNNTDQGNLYLMLRQPAIQAALLVMQRANGEIETDSLGKYKSFHQRHVQVPDYIFPLSIATGETVEIFLRVASNDQLQLPLYLGSEQIIQEKVSTKNLLFGLYAGAVLIMMLYNFFLGISTKSASYIYYIIYIFFVGLTQALFQGYTFMYLWPNSIWMAQYSSIFIPVLSGITTITFIKAFLHTKRNTPKLDKGINLIVVLYILGLLVGLFEVFYGVILLQTIASCGSIYVLYVVNKIRLKGYRPAGFFLIAFSLFFLSVIIFVLRNVNLVPYNTFTSYILEIGSLLEISLLSFALADRINFYRKEKEASQAQALQISQENARIIREQNLLLETEVDKRTTDLKRSNEHLNEAMYNLKQAQTHLVESEKLASLGMLTAGIAHEINNPINFVTASVRPLSRDIDHLMEALDSIERIAIRDISNDEKAEVLKKHKEDIDIDYLKEEIKLLLKGIQEGAFRTAEIVKSLRIFSRVDEDDLKLADLNQGLESTLVILNSLFKDRIYIEKGYGEIPFVECFPGKLNQVFLNLITNAIHAVDAKFKGHQGGEISVRTFYQQEHVCVSVRDNGIGVKEEVKDKIFDPFFTTKDVGEGTGLGLAIVMQTIAKHNGEIQLITKEGGGSEFLIRIPVSQEAIKKMKQQL